MEVEEIEGGLIMSSRSAFDCDAKRRNCIGAVSSEGKNVLVTSSHKKVLKTIKPGMIMDYQLS